MLPVISVTAPCEGVMMINCAPIGEVPCAAPAPLAGDAILTFFPYDAEYLPGAAVLRLREGVIREHGVKGAYVTQWPGGLYHARMLLSPSPCPAEILDSIAFNGGEASLCRDRQGLVMRILYDTGDECTLSEPGARFGEIVAAEGTSPLIMMRSRLDGSEALRGAQDGCEVFQLYGSEITFEPDGARIRVTRPLRDTAGHIERAAYRLTDKGLITDEYSISKGCAEGLAPAALVRAMTDAILLGLEEEAMACLSPAMRGDITPFQLKACMLPFERYEDAPPPRKPQQGTERLALIHEESRNFAIARVFEYDIGEDGLITSIRGCGEDAL